MKRQQAEFPFQDYWLYIVFHRKENRRMANLIRKDKSGRTTISYARYLMSVNQKRLLTCYEEVDHIDNDKTNDNLSNLQILSPEDNLKKQNLINSSKSKVIVNCSNCNSEYLVKANNYRFKLKAGQTRFFCTRKCLHELLRKD